MDCITLSKNIINHTQWEQEEEILLLEETTPPNSIVLYNDDFNTFDFVIQCLVEVCEHTLEQAEQCTYLVHYKGKCEVKSGAKEELEPRYRELLNRGLTAEIH